jgi:preprotein translocase subunit YajC
MASVVFLFVLFGAMWFVTIRPQQRRLRDQRALVSTLEVGDEVITVGGIVGRVTKVDDLEIQLDSDGTKLRLSRAAVTQRFDGAS